MEPGLHLAQVSPADLDVPVLGQLPPAQLPLSDALKPGPLEIISLDAPLGSGPLGSSRWNTRRGTRTTPRYSPTSTPNSAACRSAFQRASSGKVKNIVGSARALASLVTFSKRFSARIATGAT